MTHSRALVPTMRSAVVAGMLLSQMLLFASPCDATWNKIAHFPWNAVSMWFFNDQVGLVGLNTGSPIVPILRTTDGGQTWRPVTTPSSTRAGIDVTDIWFRDSQEGWASLFFLNELWHTMDGGLTWNAITMSGGLGAVRQTSHAIVATDWQDPGGMFSSSNGGTTFVRTPSAQTVGLDFVDDLHGVASGYSTPFMYTSDGGVTWQLSLTNVTNEAFGVYGLKHTCTFYVVPEAIGTSDTGVLRSTDNGVHWINTTTQVPRIVGDIKGIGRTLYIQTREKCAPTGLFRSTDEGATWVSIGGPNTVHDSRFFVLCSGVIYAADSAGGLYKSTDGGDGYIPPCELTLADRGASISPTILQLGAASHCRAKDSSITVYNSGCNGLTINDIHLLHGNDWSATDSLGLSLLDTIVLPLDGVATVRLRYSPNGRDSANDTLVLELQSSSLDTTIRIPLLGNWAPIDPAIDSVTFFPSIPDSLSAGERFAVSIFPDRPVSNTTLLSISGIITYPTDDFDFDSLSASTGLRLQSSRPMISGSMTRVLFSVSSASGIVLDPARPIVRLWLRAVVADTTNFRVWLDSVTLNSGDPAYAPCAFSTMFASSSLRPVCGDGPMRQFLAGTSLFFAEDPKPNPAIDAVTIRFHNVSSLGIEYSVVDGLGKTRRHGRSSNSDLTLDVSSLPQGVYYFRAVNEWGMQLTKKIVVIR